MMLQFNNQKIKCMKRKVSYQKGIIGLFCVLFVSLLFVQCKKDGTNASLVSRALVNTPDTTIFSPFYDSTVVPFANLQPGINDIVVTAGEKTDLVVNMVPVLSSIDSTEPEPPLLYPVPARSEIEALLPEKMSGTVNIRIISQSGNIFSPFRKPCPPKFLRQKLRRVN